MSPGSNQDGGVMSRFDLYNGDSLEVLKEMGDNSVDALVTDPPAGIGFMGLAFDSDKGGRDQWIAWLASIMREVRRVLKPGAHGLVWALPRTSHWTATALEDSGLEIRDRISHLFGSGFPKSLNLPGGYGTALKPSMEDWWLVRKPLAGTVAKNVAEHGTGALNIDNCRIDPGTYVPGGGNGEANHGGAFGGAGMRQGTRDVVDPHDKGRWPSHLLLSHHENCEQVGTKRAESKANGGAQKLWSHYRDDSEPNVIVESKPKITPNADHLVKLQNSDEKNQFNYEGEEVPVYECVEGCPVRELDEQAGVRTTGRLEPHHQRNSPRMGHGGVYGDDAGQHSASAGRSFGGTTGGASRFFYCSKPSRAEREMGMRGFKSKTAGEMTGGRKEGSAGLNNPRAGAGRGRGAKNHHPTLKPIELMRYLIKLITPKDGTVLDPFMGSGTTGMAAAFENRRFIGIELDPEFFDIAQARIQHADKQHRSTFAGLFGAIG